MNKLVSKNPVLRFKLGKKIVKALLGSALKSVLGSTITGLVVGRYLNRPTNNPKRRVKAKVEYGPVRGVNPDGTPSNATHLRWNVHPETGEYISGLYVKNGNKYWNGSDGSVTLMGPNDGPIKKPVRPLRRNPSRRNPVRSTPTIAESANHSPEDTLPVSDFLSKQENLTLNIPTAPVASVQGRLKEPYGSYLDNTMLLGDNDIKFLRNNLRIKPELRTSPITYDRSGTRDWIRNNLGKGAYDFTGALRRALRYWLNGDKDGLNYDKNLLGVFGDLSLYAKQGAKLISRNPVERFKTKLGHLNFKLSRTTTALKNGGNIPKLLTGWTPLLWNKPDDTFTQTVISRVGNLANEAENRAKRVKKVTRNTRIPEDVAGLLDLLWLSGAFKGVIDKRTGKLITYERAVDGKMGSMTLLAINNSKRTIHSPLVNNNKINLASVIPNFNISSFISSLFKKNNYIPSDKHNLLAVIEHKMKTGVTDPYLYISPREGMLYRLQGDSVLYKTPIATGVNFDSDGLTELPQINESRPGLNYDRTITTSSTPAGVFTLGYRGEYSNEPKFNLLEGEEGNRNAKIILAALHAPASLDRQKKLMNGNHQLTFGCIQLPSGEMKCLDRNLNLGDSVYIEPTVNGNYLYEDKDGHIKTHFRSTPSNVSGTLWGKRFNANNVRYNIGY